MFVDGTYEVQATDPPARGLSLEDDGDHLDVRVHGDYCAPASLGRDEVSALRDACDHWLEITADIPESAHA